MWFVRLALLFLLISSAPGASFEQSAAPGGDDGEREATSPEPSIRSSEVIKVLGVSLAGAEFGEQHLPGRINHDYVYPTQRGVYDYYSAKGFSIIRLPFLWERLQPRAFGPLAPGELAAIRSVLDLAASAD